MDTIKKCPLCGGDAGDGICTSCGYAFPAAELDENTRIMNADPGDYPEANKKRIPVVKLFRREIPEKLEGKDELFFTAAEEIQKDKDSEKLPHLLKVLIPFFAGFIVGFINPIFPLSVIAGGVINALAKASNITGADESAEAFGKALIIGAAAMLIRLCLGLFGYISF